jgi:Protein of unknown function (DUF3592)
MVVIAPARALAVQINHSGSAATSTGHSGAFGLVIVILGFALVCRGVVPMIKFGIFRTRARRTPGRVVENVPHARGRHSTNWSPIVEFEAGGDTVLSLIATARESATRPLGSVVSVLYDPDNPRQVRLEDTPLPISTMLLTGIAVIGIYFAIVL